MDGALWLKALHIMAFTAWMAGMWYLPRLMVYHAGAAVGSEASETFKVMERRLLKAITTPAMVVTLLAGLRAGHRARRSGATAGCTASLLLVVLMLACHGILAAHVRRFQGDERPKSATLVSGVQRGADPAVHRHRPARRAEAVLSSVSLHCRARPRPIDERCMTDSTDDISGTGESLADIIPAAAPPPRRRRGRPPASEQASRSPGWQRRERAAPAAAARPRAIAGADDAAPDRGGRAGARAPPPPSRAGAARASPCRREARAAEPRSGSLASMPREQREYPAARAWSARQRSTAPRAAPA